jgi:hypothetical protein
MSFEIVVSSPLGAIKEAVDFGEDKAIAERVLNWTWNGLLRNGFTSSHSTANPNLIRFNECGGQKEFYVELREKQPEPIRIHWVGAVVQAEQHAVKVKAAKHKVAVTRQDGFKQVHPLADDREQAVSQFTAMVLEAEAAGGKAWRGMDSAMKYVVFSARGTTTFEFVEVQPS